MALVMDQIGECLMRAGVVADIRNQHWAGFYSSAHPDAVDRHPAEFASFYCQHERYPRQVVDVGCGNGRDAVYMAAHGHTVIGIDSCPEAIVIAKKESDRHELPLRFECLSAERVPNLPQPCEIAYLRCVLQSVNDSTQERIFNILRRWLAAPGKLYIEDLSANVYGVYSRDHIVTNVGYYRRMLVPNKLAMELRIAGFDVVFCEETADMVRVIAQFRE